MSLRKSAFGALRTYSRRAADSRPAMGCLFVQQRFVEYWGITVTGRTQPYAQGDMLPRLDNMRCPVNKATSAAASITGDPSGIAYDASNIFRVEGFSPLEKAHYQPLRGITRHKIEPLPAHVGKDVTTLLKELSEEGSLEEHWWGRLVHDFPSMQKPCTPKFKGEWEKFFEEACSVAHDDKAVQAMSRPFLERQMQENFISYAMVWRISERLCDAFDTAPDVTPYEKRFGRLAVERVTKLMLDTIADQPWSNQDATNPLLVDISNFRAWHEAGNW